MAKVHSSFFKYRNGYEFLPSTSNQIIMNLNKSISEEEIKYISESDWSMPQIDWQLPELDWTMPDIDWTMPELDWSAFDIDMQGFDIDWCSNDFNGMSADSKHSHTQGCRPQGSKSHIVKP